MRGWPGLAIVLLPAAIAAQDVPMTRAGLDSALAQYFAGADRDANGRLDRGETADALGYARSMLSVKREDEPFTLDVSDGRPRLMLNDRGPLGQGGIFDILFARTDRDHDGALTLGEVQSAGRERFDAVDRDRDGILDEGERQAAREQLGMLSGLLSR